MALADTPRPVPGQSLIDGAGERGRSSFGFLRRSLAAENRLGTPYRHRRDASGAPFLDIEDHENRLRLVSASNAAAFAFAASTSASRRSCSRMIASQSTSAPVAGSLTR